MPYILRKYKMILLNFDWPSVGYYTLYNRNVLLRKAIKFFLPFSNYLLAIHEHLLFNVLAETHFFIFLFFYLGQTQ